MTEAFILAPMALVLYAMFWLGFVIFKLLERLDCQTIFSIFEIIIALLNYTAILLFQDALLIVRVAVLVPGTFCLVFGISGLLERHDRGEKRDEFGRRSESH